VFASIISSIILTQKFQIHFEILAMREGGKFLLEEVLAETGE
jgi:hypothetical protein